MTKTYHIDTGITKYSKFLYHTLLFRPNFTPDYDYHEYI
jgi:hypothetical protein